MRKLGVLPKLKEPSKSESKPKAKKKPSNTNEEAAIQFLKSHKDAAFDVIEPKWKETHKTRMADIKTPAMKLETVTSKYPLLSKLDKGYLLVKSSIKQRLKLVLI